MKVLFLDHDGVVCLPLQWGTRFKKMMIYDSHTEPDDYHPDDYPIDVRMDLFDPDCVKVLNEIIEETGCEIVISSDWKLHASLEELQLLYTHYGVIKQPIAFTPNFKEEWVEGGFYWNHNERYEIMRSYEVQQYLKEHPEVTHWAAIDDMLLARFVNIYWQKENPYDREWGLENFVHSHYEHGLKGEGIKEKIIQYLK